MDWKEDMASNLWIFRPGCNAPELPVPNLSSGNPSMAASASRATKPVRPQQSYAYQAVASVLSVQRAVSVPLGITTPDQPNISSTIWRTVSDQKNLVYYFDSATRPNTFWVTLAKLNLERGAHVKKLTIQNGEVFSPEVSDQFTDAKPFAFLQAAN
jgi:penicillin V acylase-like amidase (Ntn superfamily)